VNKTKENQFGPFVKKKKENNGKSYPPKMLFRRSSLSATSSAATAARPLFVPRTQQYNKLGNHTEPLQATNQTFDLALSPQGRLAYATDSSDASSVYTSTLKPHLAQALKEIDEAGLYKVQPAPATTSGQEC